MTLKQRELILFSQVPWIVNYFETALVQVWYPMTVCTNSNAQRQLILKHLIRTEGEERAKELIDLKERHLY